MKRFDMFQKYYVLLSVMVIGWLGLLYPASVVHGESQKPNVNDIILSASDSQKVTFTINNDSDAQQTLDAFAIAATRQTGFMVSFEVIGSMAKSRLRGTPNSSLSIYSWLRQFQLQMPRLTWINHGSAINIRMSSVQLHHNVLEDKFTSDYISSLSVDDWFAWLGERFPEDDFMQGIGTFDGLNVYGFGPMDGGSENVRIKIHRDENVREFLTDLAYHYKGTWIARLKDPTSKQLLPSVTKDEHIGHIKETNTISLVK